MIRNNKTKKENEIYFHSSPKVYDVRRFQNKIYELVDFRGFSKITLNFSKVNEVFPDFIIPMCSFVMYLIDEEVSFDIVLPENEARKKQFINCGWANLMSPHIYKDQAQKKELNIPATVFRDGKSQNLLVNSCLDSILSSYDKLKRSDFDALEWSINEICDNVINHSESPVGGILQMDLRRKSNEVEFIVSDAGIGIPDSLRSINYKNWEDDFSLEQSIKQGVTRDPEFGQGNGLFGTYQMSFISGGTFHINSGFAHLVCTRGGDVQIRKDNLKIKGSSIVCSINFSTPNLLKEALAFKGEDYSMVDFVELAYEQDDGSVFLKLTDEVTSFGNRDSGLDARRKINNLIRMSPGRKIVIDMSDISIISSSFADEVFGKLNREYGEEIYNETIVLKNISEVNRSLINKAIRQRREVVL